VRTPFDALRSLSLYLSDYVLPTEAEDWEVRLALDEQTFKRPFCRVGFAGPSQNAIQRTVTDVVRPFAVHIFPVLGSTPEESTIEASRIEALLETGFSVGVGLGHPARVPLWNFDGVAMDVATGTRGPNDYMRLRDCAIGQAVDPDDERSIVVTCNLRLSWRRSGDLIPSTTTLQRVTATPDPS
jgi:hypothetical protein